MIFRLVLLRIAFAHFFVFFFRRCRLEFQRGLGIFLRPFRKLGVTIRRPHDFERELAIAVDDVFGVDGRLGRRIRIFVLFFLPGRFLDVVRFLRFLLILNLHIALALFLIGNGADFRIQNFYDNLIVSIFLLQFPVQIFEIFIRAEALDDFARQIVFLATNEIRKRDDAAAAHFENHIAVRLIFRHGKYDGLHFFFAAIGLNPHANENVVSRRHNHRRRRRIHNLRGLSLARHVHIDFDLAKRIGIETILLQNFHDIVNFIYAALGDIISRPIHIFSRESRLLGITRIKCVRQGNGTLAPSVDEAADSAVDRRRRKGRQKRFFRHHAHVQFLLRAVIPVIRLDVKRREIRKLAGNPGNGRTAILIDDADIRPDGAELKRNLMRRHNGENIGVSHEIGCLAATHERMSKRHHPVSVNIRHGPDGAQFQIAGDKGSCHRAAFFERNRRIVPICHGRRIGNHIEFFHFLGQVFHGLVGIAGRHERRRKRHQIGRRARHEAGCLFVVHRPHLHHVFNRRHHADPPIRIRETVANRAQQFSVDIDGAAAHALRNAARLIDNGTGHFDEHQIAAIRAFILENAQHIHIKCRDIPTVHDGLRIPMHPLAHFGNRHKFHSPSRHCSHAGNRQRQRPFLIHLPFHLSSFPFDLSYLSCFPFSVLHPFTVYREPSVTSQ